MGVNLPIPSLPSMTPWQKKTLVVVVAVLAGYAFGRYAQPAKVQIQTQTVVKQVEVEHHDTVTETKEVKLPNGTVETDTTVVDKDVDTTNAQSSTSASEVITNVKPQWRIEGLGGYDFDKMQTVYGAEVERRIIGPVFLGAWGTNQRAMGLSVGIEF